jgi:uncharacterized protein
MNGVQLIQKPLGINVFGSSILRVEPDVASLQFGVSRLAQHPRDAFGDTRAAVQSVRAYLTQAALDDVGTSRITLSRSFRYTGGEQQFVGYVAKVTFHVLLSDLDRMEEVLSGVVDAGANEVSSVEFQTRRLKEVRAEVRRRAVQAAREKAENYCKAAGLTLGTVLHLEDVNPDVLRGTGEGHTSREPSTDDGGPLRAFDPGSIVVGAAVAMAFGIKG